MLPLLAESALRSLVLAFAIWALLRLLRVRNPHVLALAWKAVLGTALLMPLLMQWNAVTVPVAGFSFPAIDVIAGAAPAATGVNWPLLLLLAYAAVAITLLVRYVLNLGTGWVLVRRARPLEGAPMAGATLRASRHVRMPATFGATILVPMDFMDWDAGQRNAVLLHECTHIRNRDFYWQMAAQLHRIVFWFSPLAWYLPRQLSALAEDLSDDAAIEGMSDRLMYAGILLNISARHREIPAALAMARPATLPQRIDRILRERRCWPQPRRMRQAAVLLALAPAALIAAGGSPGDVPQVQPDRILRIAQTNNAPPAESPPTRPLMTRRAPGVGPEGLSKPPYPPESWAQREEGFVVLRLHIMEDGSVSQAQVTQSSGFPRLDAAAAQHATMAWKFRPATENGAPVAVWHEFRVKFSMKDWGAP